MILNFKFNIHKSLLEIGPESYDFFDLKPLCDINEVPCLYVDDINSTKSVEWIKNLNPDVIFCFGWSSLIKERILNIAPMGVIGYHVRTGKHDVTDFDWGQYMNFADKHLKIKK